MKKYLLIAGAVIGLISLCGCSDSVTGSDCEPYEGSLCYDGSTMMVCSGYILIGTDRYTVDQVDDAVCDCYRFPSCKSKKSDNQLQKTTSNLLVQIMENKELKSSIDEMYIDLGREIQQ